MSRVLSSSALEAMYAQETDKVFLMLVKFDHDDMVTPIRVVNNYDNVTSNGEEFIAYPFMFSLPDEVEDSLSQIELTITNVNRLLVDNVRNFGSPITVTLEIVLSDSPDTVEAGPFIMSMREVKYDAMLLTGTCTFQDILNESYPEGSYTPASYPGLF